ncbi:UDP-N-acetyl-D-mannosamine dehydrogenase [[Haemophilus] ducreyi]|uniref:UDP-N-acetyl-D-mannosamine dehydrogenase n=1 Tax=Haemophilus ducreyi TaxID=730 RepID=UPI0006555480|nr:UDP-N-acetyl-D-mannosamine dehydrogenase [[Haemophilus] ducreyi]AKO45913.1 UDP-N-acetyl-D-mannosaminuronic acid dehydrogenase [[Haemophilus] ducreyi]AKO47273.1 UDP-N-acetyl-D-mannosaminuronic acid dehydrogenase [[Haemophilus] ducreyi]AKO48637.1 UDP-N-acetyl-D-mannosaminuronic acid dehydrogenase [[Haemophilus] ducreyi]AKO50008.1 UDP-N-acetyl-D-mannosaminuronic acid dehydrogenase [[Haemophilus] ducreyi]ANF61920.1 UDP-N-acetyl-D-mannosaminuronic acid dehydrogenase [[Haemophilus] ducreyi]
MNSFQTISVVGLGYIGLPTAAVFAQAGKRVLGVDINPQTVATINQGNIHIVEPALAEVVQQAVEKGGLSASTAVQPADVFIIAVPTPLDQDHQPDLSYIKAAAEMIAPHLQAGNLVVLESTSPVGTTEQLAEWLQQARPDLLLPTSTTAKPNIQLAYCPERVLPGKVMTELLTNDRVIGGITAEATQQAVDLYKIFVKGRCIPTNARTAEMCKLTENSFRDVNIAFANELSMVCDQLNINVWQLIALANCHPRVNILQPSAGVGGHCIAVDPWFIVAQAPQQARLIQTARQVNDAKPHWVIKQIKQMWADCVMANNCRPSDIKIACLGLAFKPDIDDLRASPALEITQHLTEWQLAELMVVEPNITDLPTSLVGKAQLVSLEYAMTQTDILVLLVAHTPFKAVASQLLSAKWRLDICGLQAVTRT